MPIEPTWPAVGLAAVAQVATWIFIIKQKSNSRNSNSKPPCGVHSEKIAKLEKTDELREKWLDEFKKTNSLEHGELSRKLDELNRER